MKTAFKNSFARDLKGVKDKHLLQRIQRVILEIEQVDSPHNIPHLAKLKGKGNYYRVLIGDYRLGITIESETVTFVRCLNRRDIYHYFP